MNRISIADTTKYVGKRVKICGWVHSRRDHGKIIFIDLRDRSGLVQVVFQPTTGQPASQRGEPKADSLRPEWVIGIEGTVNKRPKGMINPKLETGKVEVLAEKLEILNKSKVPPFEISGGKKASEEKRLEYRYLDLRRERMKDNIIFRHKVVKLIRNFLDKKGLFSPFPNAPRRILCSSPGPPTTKTAFNGSWP